MKTKTKLTVRYAETDQMGIVHHSNYPVWFEAGRTDFIRQTGVSYSDIEARGVLMPLYEIACRFKSPARYEDEVTVVTSLKELSRVRIILSYEVVRDSDGALLATGETLHAFTDKGLRPLNAERAAPDVYKLLKAALEVPSGFKKS
ncbi:acyl-CoA thioester hydrolase [Sporobacter termitidis DSM 10068]|uniref:Acyl-CoA thioester hydrolase n=1 Tax=Sporobacter termitidis DSM 10068 TaxID=1123282 RepID=A0A1M5YMU2_9FIRM|nr:thioesterase family protein [Sporobacter termitidis]SHI12883.1 acyl-CoA thioester hydrolase [Sporobacter termitidis DSM 10068]